MKKQEKLPTQFYENESVGSIRFEIDNQEDKKLEIDIFDFNKLLENLHAKCLDEKALELVQKHIKQDGVEVTMIGLYTNHLERFRYEKIASSDELEEDQEMWDWWTPGYCEDKLLMPITFELPTKTNYTIQIPPQTKVGLNLFLRFNIEKTIEEWCKLLGYEYQKIRNY